jgi:hypothetical protein
MRPIFNFEIIFHEKHKKVYIYKIEQTNFMKKQQDIREVIKNILLNFYV